MHEMKYEFTQGQIIVDSSINIQHIEKLNICGKLGVHGTVELQVLLSETEGQRCINSVHYGDEFLIYGLENDNKKLLFSGYISEIEVESNSGLYIATIKGISWTGLLDYEKKSRSFQDKTVSYDALFMKVLTDYPGSSFISATAESSQATRKFLLQYQETDWEFCQRIASILGTYLVPDMMARLPRFCVGLSKHDKEITAVESSVSKKDYDGYQRAFSLGILLPEEFFIKYFVCCKERLELGDKVTYQNKAMVVEEKCIAIENGVVRYRYVLAREEVLFTIRKFNEQIKGVSLIGEVLDSSNQKIKMKLSIDSEQGMDAACWFPYASQADNLFYCMPEKGTTVSLYFSDSDETGAIAMNAVRKNGGSCSKTSNPSMKYMATPEGKELKLGIDDLDFSAHEQLFMKIKDDGGVTVNSNLDLNIITQHKLSLEAKELIKVFATTGDIIVGVKDEESTLYLIGGPDGDAHIKAGSNLIYDGRKKEVFTERLNKEIAYEEKKFEWGKLFTNVLIGLAAVAAVALTVATFGAAGPVIAGAVISGCLAVGAMAVSDIMKGEVSSAEDYFFAGLKGAIEGAVSGAIMGALPINKMSLLTHMFVSGATSFFTDAISQTIDIVFRGKKYDWKQGLLAFGIGFAMPAVAAGMKKGLQYVLKKCGKSMPQSMRNIFCVLCGEPVDAISGNMISDTVDFELPGPLPLQWRRIWISANRVVGHLGAGTRYNYEMGLEILEEEQALVLYLNDGRVAAFPMLLVGEEYFDYANALLLKRDEGGYKVFDPATRYTYVFCSSLQGYFEYKLTKVINDLGHSILFYYNSYGYLDKIVDSVGRELLVETNGQGRITQIALKEEYGASILVSYDYNFAQDLVSIKDALGKVTKLEYKNHFMVRKIDRNNNSFYWEYDKYEDGARTTKSWGDGGTLSIWINYFDCEMFNEVRTSEKGRGTRYYYNEQHLCTKTIYSDYTEVKSNYNELYQLESKVDEEGRLTSFRYNSMSQIVQITRADSSKIIMNYDENCRLREVKDPEGYSRFWEYNEDGTLSELVDESGNSTRYEYNVKKLVNKVITPREDTIELLYDEQSNINKVILPNGNQIVYKYDYRGNCISTQNVYGAKDNYIYDKLNRLTKACLADGNVMTLEYDSYDKVICVRDNWTKVNYTYTILGNILSQKEGSRKIEYKYDQEERLVSITNENGEIYSYDRDCKGNIIRETSFDDVVLEYERDNSGLITKIIRPNDRFTQYTYDKLGRILRVDYFDKSFEEFAYNKNGKVINAKNQDFDVTFERDCFGNVLKEYQENQWVETKYDELGNKVELTTCYGANIVSQRNVMGQITHMLAQCNGQEPLVSQINYNELGEEVGRKVSGGVISSFDYDMLGRVKNHKIGSLKDCKSHLNCHYEWDVNLRLKKKVDEINKSNIIYSYNQFGNLISSRQDSMKVYRQFDDVGNIYGTPERYDRLYDKGGRLRKAEINPQEQSMKAHGEYGKTAQLALEFFYDEEGNLLQKKDEHDNIWNYSYYGNGMLKQVEMPSGKVVRFRYDALGRRIEKTVYREKKSGAGLEVAKRRKYMWNEDVIIHEWDEIKLNNASSNRIVDFKADYVLNMEKKLESVGECGKGKLQIPNNLITWIFQDDFKVRGKITEDGSYSILTDYLGVPLQAFDQSGTMVWDKRLDINGKIRDTSRKFANVIESGLEEDDFIPFRYPGQYEDVETGLYYNRYRYYDPEIGQYTQQDPIGYAGGNPTVYGYVWDTLGEIDPYGLASRLPKWMPTAWGYQRHHIIPYSVWTKYDLSSLGLNINGSYNMTYLPVAEGIDKLHPNSSLHLGYNRAHAAFNQYMDDEVMKILQMADDLDWDTTRVQQEIRNLQTKTRYNLKDGIIKCH